MSKKLSAKELSVNQNKIRLTAENGNLIVNTVDENGELVAITSTTEREQEISSLAALASESESLQTVATSHSTYGAVRTDVARGEGSSQQTFILDDRQFSSKPIVTATLVGNENDPKHYVLISDISETSTEGIYQVTFEFSDDIPQYQSNGTTLTNYKLNILAVVDGTDTDLDGIPDHTDTDDDNDGILDVDEPNPILTEDEDSGFYLVNDEIESGFSGQSPALPKLSEDGNTLAVAYPDSQVLRVFDIDGSNGWVQRGTDITILSHYTNISPNKGCPRNLSLSGDGNRVAVNMSANNTWYDTQVFEWANNAWSQIGGNIVISAKTTSVHLDYDGSSLIIGSHTGQITNNVAEAKVFTYSGSSWIQQGDSLPVGWVGAMNRDGSIIAVASRPGTTTHHARIYEWNASDSSWDQKGSNINMGAPFNIRPDFSLSSDGNVICIQSSYQNGTGLTVYYWDDTDSDWKMKGSTVMGVGFKSALYGTEISNDGLTLLVGFGSWASTVGINYQEAEIRIYTWNQTDDTWELVGKIEDESYSTSGISGSENRYLGSLSKNGNRFAIGGELSSYVKVYQISNS